MYLFINEYKTNKVVTELYKTNIIVNAKKLFKKIYPLKLRKCYLRIAYDIFKYLVINYNEKEKIDLDLDNTRHRYYDLATIKTFIDGSQMTFSDGSKIDIYYINNPEYDLKTYSLLGDQLEIFP